MFHFQVLAGIPPAIWETRQGSMQKSTRYCLDFRNADLRQHNSLKPSHLAGSGSARTVASAFSGVALSIILVNV
jgi:hypothetical protein